jgi:hypothetical protein
MFGNAMFGGQDFGNMMQSAQNSFAGSIPPINIGYYNATQNNPAQQQQQMDPMQYQQYMLGQFQQQMAPQQQQVDPYEYQRQMQQYQQQQQQVPAAASRWTQCSTSSTCSSSTSSKSTRSSRLCRPSKTWAWPGNWPTSRCGSGTRTSILSSDTLGSNLAAYDTSFPSTKLTKYWCI